MTEKDKDNEVESTGDKPEDRLEAIKKEEREDASSYYAQGEPEVKDKATEERELSKPVDPVNQEKEEMSFLKTIAFLGFGLAALSIVFILFFIRDLDERVVTIDESVAKIDEKMEPFKNEINASIDKVTKDVGRLKDKVGDYERMTAVLELKRALITIQEVTADSSGDVQSKSSQVVASIHSLLEQLGEKSGAGAAPTAPVETSTEPETPTAEKPAMEEPEAAVGEIQLESEEGEAQAEAHEDAGEGEEMTAASDEDSSEEEGVEESEVSEESGSEELPSIEELLKEE